MYIHFHLKIYKFNYKAKLDTIRHEKHEIDRRKEKKIKKEELLQK